MLNGLNAKRRHADTFPFAPVLGFFDYFLGGKAAWSVFLLRWSKIEDENEN
jgi:hypothetical protein